MTNVMGDIGRGWAPVTDTGLRWRKSGKVAYEQSWIKNPGVCRLWGRRVRSMEISAKARGRGRLDAV